MATRKVGCGLLLGWLVCASGAWAEAPFSTELEENRLVKEGFHLTMRFSWGEQPMRAVEFIVPTAVENTVSVWAQAKEGEVEVELLKPDGTALLRWVGRQGGSTVTAQLSAGTYRLAVKGVEPGQGVLGVRQAALGVCPNDSTSVTQIDAQPASGFLWPYLLFVPPEAPANALLVAPNNTGFVTENPEFIRASAQCQHRRDLKLATRLGTALLIPLFPRPAVAGEGDNLYLHALSRAAITEATQRFRRVDLQLRAMIDDARARVQKKQGRPIADKVLLSGFSAAGSFANRFALLHPDVVAAVAVGSPGGWPMVPVARHDKQPLPYPVGVSDLKELVGQPLHMAAARRVRWFFYLGEDDTNDAVPYRDSFSSSAQTLIEKHFGTTPQARWAIAARLFREQGFTARFALFPHVGHTVSDEISTEVETFFREGLPKETPSPSTH